MDVKTKSLLSSLYEREEYPPLAILFRSWTGKEGIGKIFGRIYLIDYGLPSVLRKKSLYFNCHSGLDPEYSLFNWIPAGVYPVFDTGRE
jgi:hypothetical protein